MQQIAEWEAEARSELEHREFSLGRYYALYSSDSAPVGAFSRAPLAQLDVVAIPVKMTAEAVAVKEVVVAAEVGETKVAAYVVACPILSSSVYLFWSEFLWLLLLSPWGMPSRGHFGLHLPTHRHH